MDGFGTSTADMVGAGNRVIGHRDVMLGDLDGLKSRLMQLASNWTGESATTFAGLMQRWDGNAQTLGRALGDIGEALGVSARNYQAQEDEQGSQFSSINAALG